MHGTCASVHYTVSQPPLWYSPTPLRLTTTLRRCSSSLRERGQPSAHPRAQCSGQSLHGQSSYSEVILHKRRGQLHPLLIRRAPSRSSGQSHIISGDIISEKLTFPCSLLLEIDAANPPLSSYCYYYCLRYHPYLTSHVAHSLCRLTRRSLRRPGESRSTL